MHVIVDVDNTLWNFGDALYAYAVTEKKDMIPPTHWHWDTIFTELGETKCWEIINKIHSEQHIFQPYMDARKFLHDLRYRGHTITIATHRKIAYLEPLEIFLRENDLIYDHLHVSHDKTILFENADALVDDAPHTLEIAASKGLKVAGLKFKWNEHSKYPLFSNLVEVFYYITRDIIIKRTEYAK